jgi:hypothetical protein
MSTYGDFGVLSAGVDDEAYSHSVVFDLSVTDRLNYVLQTDLFDANNVEAVGINQYLLYSLNDCWGVGARVEWWKNDGRSANSATFGLNYKPHANIVLRPEVKQEWEPGLQRDQTIFGMDAIVTY